MLDVSFYAHLIALTLRGSPFPQIRRATSLLLGTVAQESAFTSTTQLGGGPALGYGQIEPATEASLWNDYLAYQAEITAWFERCCGQTGPNTAALEQDM